MLRRRLFPAYGAVERVHQMLNFDKFIPRPFRIVAIEGGGEHFGMRIAILQHAIPSFLQCIKSIAHIGPVVVCRHGRCAHREACGRSQNPRMRDRILG